jgi:hypothetical protein
MEAMEHGWSYVEAIEAIEDRATRGWRMEPEL